MGLLSIEVQCHDCGAKFGLLVDREERNTPQPCEECDNGVAGRVWSVPHVSTAKTSETIPDAVANGRFDHLREAQKVKKELSKAKKAYARNPNDQTKEDVKRARKEKAKIEGTSK